MNRHVVERVHDIQTNYQHLVGQFDDEAKINHTTWSNMNEQLRELTKWTVLMAVRNDWLCDEGVISLLVGSRSFRRGYLIELSKK